MPRNHVLAVDESAAAQKAFEFAVNTLPKDDKLFIIHGRYQAPAPPAFIKGAEMKEYEHHAVVVEKYKKLCKEAERECHFVDTHFKTVSELSGIVCNKAYETNAASIVMGSRGLSAPQRVLLGSLSYSVLASCDIPTTVVHAPQN